MRLFLSAALMLLLFACNGNDKQSSDSNNDIDELGELLERVHHCSRLEVAEYTMLKIVSFNDSSMINVVGYKISMPGERKLMIPIEVKTKIFIDLDYVTKEDISVDSSTINITLPSPNIEIYSTKEDHDLERESVSWYRANFTEQELEKFVKQGVEDAQKSIPSLEINSIAKRNTEKILQPILFNIGYSQRVNVIFKEQNIIQPTFKD